MSMPPGPDPNKGTAQERQNEIGEGIFESFEKLLDTARLTPKDLDTLQKDLSNLESRKEGSSISDDLLERLMKLLAAPLSEARRNGQVGTRLTLEGQKILYKARILAFDVWDHDGHHSSAILTDLVDMWTLREAGDMSKGRRRRWEMAKLLWVALRQRTKGNNLTIEDISLLPYDSHRRVAANPRLSQVLMEMGISAVHENPDHLNIDWFGRAGYHWWSIDDSESIGEKLENNVLEGFYRLLVLSLGIELHELKASKNDGSGARSSTVATSVHVEPLSKATPTESAPSSQVRNGKRPALDLSMLWCPFPAAAHWTDNLVITYDGSRNADGFDDIALNWRGSNLTAKIRPPSLVLESAPRVLRIVTPIPTRTDIIGPAPVF